MIFLKVIKGSFIVMKEESRKGSVCKKILDSLVRSFNFFF